VNASKSFFVALSQLVQGRFGDDDTPNDTKGTNGDVVDGISDSSDKKKK